MDIIERVLSTEQEAGRIVESAKKKADEMRRETDTRLRDEVTMARADSQDTVKKRTEQARQKAAELVHKAKDQALSKSDAYNTEHDDALTIITEKAVELIIKPEYER